MKKTATWNYFHLSFWKSWKKINLIWFGEGKGPFHVVQGPDRSTTPKLAGFEIWLLATDSEDAPFLHHLDGCCWLVVFFFLVGVWVLLVEYNHLYSSNVFLSSVQRMTVMLFDTPRLQQTRPNPTTRATRAQETAFHPAPVSDSKGAPSKRCFN